MPSTAVPPARATVRDALAAAPTPSLPALPDLLAAFATVPDPRRRQGTRFPLAAVLTLAVAALRSNHRSVLAIAPWGTDQSPDRLRALGLPAGVCPHQSTWQR